MRLRRVAVLLLALLAGACDSSGDRPERFDLMVEVTGTGDAAATRIEVTGGNSGDPVVANPPLPWRIFFFALEGESVRVVVDGSAQNGELTAVLQGNPNIDPSPATYEMEACGPGAPACMIDVEHDF